MANGPNIFQMLLVFITEQNLVGIDAVVSAVTMSPLRNIRDAT